MKLGHHYNTLYCCESKLASAPVLSEVLAKMFSEPPFKPAVGGYLIIKAYVFGAASHLVRYIKTAQINRLIYDIAFRLVSSHK